MAVQDNAQQEPRTAHEPSAATTTSETTTRRGSIFDTFKAVGAAFFGVRGGKAHDADMARLNPVHVIIVGVVCAAVFIGVLILAVRFATQ